MIRRVITVMLLVAATLAVRTALHRLDEVNSSREALSHEHAPSGLLDLQFARDERHAGQILEPWRNDDGLRSLALKTVDDDDRFIVAYVTAGIALVLLGTAIATPHWVYVVALITAFMIAGAFDWRENRALELALNSNGQLGEGTVSSIRDSAILKFSSLLVGFVGAFVILAAAMRRTVAAVRRMFLSLRRIVSGNPSRRAALGSISTQVRNKLTQAHKTAASTATPFEKLVDREAEQIFGAVANRPRDYPRVEVHHAADEPRVAFRAADVVGLSLSGGGIRSSTFNLGLLQGLHHQHLLPLFDYLSTVSGGGYIGAYWSDWISRNPPKTGDDLFPTPRGRADRIDSESERHLREFSRFLAPRWGFFEVETWTAIVAVLAGLIPALAIGLSIIGLAIVSWLTMLLPLSFDSRNNPVPITIAAVTVIVLLVFELLWFNVKTDSSASGHDTPLARWLRWGLCTVVAVGLVVTVHSLLPRVYEMYLREPVVYWPTSPVRSAVGLDSWWVLMGIEKPASVAILSPHVFDYSLAWLGTAVLLLMLRVIVPLGICPFSPAAIASFDRSVMRLLGLGVLWAAIAVIWHAIVNLDRVASAAIAAAASGGAFAALRNWIGVGLRKSDGEGFLTRLKPYVPQVLAYVTLILLAIVMGRVLIKAGDKNWMSWYAATGAMMFVAAVGLFIEPSRFGLHAFYRERLNRAFTGSHNAGRKNAKLDARANRATDAREGDDRKLCDLACRPLHLVCCAANDLSGDTVETLGRGARSAVLSRNGVAVGDYTAQAPEISLGSAITASAAAFNSNMGMVSKRVGPAVSFLMTALNLRLGLWVRHPKAAPESVRRWPGLLLYREMFGLTSASGSIDGDVPLSMRDVHLSDGGHFENLGLYELVRRHCRYILVSDCGADPSAAFNDVGNAMRRIREDFGIDISLDIEPLRADPVTRLCRQHVAVGTIHYSALDRGILLCVKPTLTGDEPPDVLQYSVENHEFPHQTTGDQFYDEAQFESYRRLGLHIAEEVFAFVPPSPSVEPAAGKRQLTADWVFAEAFHSWGPTPDGLAESVLAMTARFGELEVELQRQSRDRIFREVFPELSGAMLADTPPGEEACAEAPPAPLICADPQDLAAFMRVVQLMEDAWVACKLDAWWDHPLNLGWINLFARWATSPSFRYWWPVLCPMYSPGFRDFINERFPVRLPKPNVSEDSAPIDVPQAGVVSRLTRETGSGLSELWWNTRSTQPQNRKGRTLYQNLVTLPIAGQHATQLQIGLAAVLQIEDGDKAVGWTSDDFFVPPSYWGAGFGWYFLNGLMLNLKTQGYRDCYVVVKAPPHDAHHLIALDDHKTFILQYRKIGFRQLELRDEQTHRPNMAVVDALGLDEVHDMLFHVDLPEWAKLRGK